MGLLSTIYSFIHSDIFGLASSYFIRGASPTAVMVVDAQSPQVPGHAADGEQEGGLQWR